MSSAKNIEMAEVGKIVQSRDNNKTSSNNFVIEEKNISSEKSVLQAICKGIEDYKKLPADSQKEVLKKLEEEGLSFFFKE